MLGDASSLVSLQLHCRFYRSVLSPLIPPLSLRTVYAASVVGAPRRMLNDPDGLSGLLGGFYLFGGRRAHLGGKSNFRVALLRARSPPIFVPRFGAIVESVAIALSSLYAGLALS